MVLKLLSPVGVRDQKCGAVALSWFEGAGTLFIYRWDGRAQLIEHPEAAPEGPTPLQERFSFLFRRAALESRSPLLVRAAAVADDLLSDPRDIGVLHGDLHQGNILPSSTRDRLAIDPKGLFGERTYDAANILCNPAGMDDLVANETRLLRNAEILAEMAGLDLTRLLAFTFAHACLSACWSEEDGDDPSLALRVAAIVEPHVSGFAG